MPTYVPKEPKIKGDIPRTVSNSPLCHLSVGKWMKAANKELASAGRKDRCARLTANVTAQLVVHLNDWIQSAETRNDAKCTAGYRSQRRVRARLPAAKLLPILIVIVDEPPAGCSPAPQMALVAEFGSRFYNPIVPFSPGGPPLTTDTPESIRKAQIDALLLKLPGVSARKINGLDAYFVSDKMFACISGGGVGLRLPAAAATELQFSRDNVVPFQPGGVASTREWIQIDRADAAEYEKDLDLFQASLEFVKGARSR